MTKKKQDEWQFFRKPSGHIAYNKNACIANANASRATVWLSSAVIYLISADNRTGHPRKRGKQSVWTPTAIGGASPKHSLSGAKPPSPHFRSSEIFKK